ncbi:hypothetical protein DCAR_0935567 [Daucus carota subsp. sativus]|uniref:Protein kinase domain-containing protein n=1 Tax=Daucus carota subsp. sativus TaxID=79200 RepID=A0AAF0XXC5_DAUCS|nr:PREDICTED: probable serine/threonine-protein kinase NAK [Daucus carota subsp. sativus]WOH16018.1 hypothetical protein DCAR_0935567 [Daucus carota subsp. sativus]
MTDRNDANCNEQYWLNEINILGRLCHPNLVKLIGYCLKKKHRLLVYHGFMPQRSLRDYLSKRVSYFQPLSWNLRLSIALGAAKALAYLHSPEAYVVHGDIHTGNILIDSKFNAKLSGFEFAKDGPEPERTHVSATTIRGTNSYMAPEYVETGHQSMKSDIFSFGGVLVEILTGKSVFEILKHEHDPVTNVSDADHTSKQALLTGQHDLYITSEFQIMDVIDADIQGQYTVDAALRVSSLTLKCLSLNPKSRPDANQVVNVLEQL